MQFDSAKDAKSYAKARGYKVVFIGDNGRDGIMYRTKRDERNSDRLADAGDCGHHQNSLAFDIVSEYEPEDHYYACGARVRK